MEKVNKKRKTKQNSLPIESCIYCNSTNVKMIYEGLETDTYKCLECKRKYGITDLRRMAGFTKKEIGKMDRKKKRKVKILKD